MKTILRSVLLSSAIIAVSLPSTAQHTPPDVYKVVAPKPKLKDIPLIKEPVVEEQVTPEATFVTGGIGEDERLSIEAAKANYNVHVTSAKTTGEFVDEAEVVIRRGDVEVLSTEIGPLLYVQLPVGKYTMEARYKDQTITQNFVISLKKKTATVRLGWKPPVEAM